MHATLLLCHVPPGSLVHIGYTMQPTWACLAMQPTSLPHLLGIPWHHLAALPCSGCRKTSERACLPTIAAQVESSAVQ